MTLQESGALGFGLVIGWFLYFVNRYRRGDASFTDIVTVLGAIGGAAVTSLFESGTRLFGAYGVGLAIGFFGYFVVLVAMVALSRNFDVDYFLDGRRKTTRQDEAIPDAVQAPSFAFDEAGATPAVQAGVAAGIAVANAMQKGR